MSDSFGEAINSPAGHLAEVLLKRFPESKEDLSADFLARLSILVDSPGRFGFLARVRLAAAIPFLFQRAPGWTKEKLIPMFDWSSSPDAADAWSARKYSSWIGSPELFGLLKSSFLAMFERPDTPGEELRFFADWLGAILLANQKDRTGFPLSPAEARSVLRRAGPRALTSLAHRLATEMEAAKSEEKVERWRTAVAPVFKATWPLDVDLQSPATTFKLVQIISAAGDAFPEAADLIIPFIRPERAQSHTTVYSIASFPEKYYTSSPQQVLDLLVAVIGEAPIGSVFSLNTALTRLRDVAPKLTTTRKFQNLLNAASPHV
ncbi:hypothetical protein HU675_0033830 [Bradyrhizobium septentrionale]|uniref:hypothetical protein n=1 Tax=Bradyrhizobium septentrionale TaxID=1404411 RepID=UPI001596C8F5|nr:hypothetical protein [Bradyrhizobium septentrionale]UGY22918.1 hypothetical protein HU675_0033830 [Bradyrhizobium septentrionale]